VSKKAILQADKKELLEDQELKQFLVSVIAKKLGYRPR
jgi:hypothetical protein